MKIVAYQIETTGLDASKHQALQVSAVLVDTNKPIKSLEELEESGEIFNVQIVNEELTGSPDVLTLHAGLIANIESYRSSRDYLDEYELDDLAQYYSEPRSLSTRFSKWLLNNEAYIQGSTKVNFAGIGIDRFHLPFSAQVFPDFKSYVMRVSNRRTIDPAMLFTYPEDDGVQNFNTLVERAGTNPDFDVRTSCCLTKAYEVAKIVHGYYHNMKTVRDFMASQGIDNLKEVSITLSTEDEDEIKEAKIAEGLVSVENPLSYNPNGDKDSKVIFDTPPIENGLVVDRERCLVRFSGESIKEITKELSLDFIPEYIEVSSGVEGLRNTGNYYERPNGDLILEFYGAYDEVIKQLHKISRPTTGNSSVTVTTAIIILGGKSRIITDFGMRNEGTTKAQTITVKYGGISVCEDGIELGTTYVVGDTNSEYFFAKIVDFDFDNKFIVFDIKEQIGNIERTIGYGTAYTYVRNNDYDILCMTLPQIVDSKVIGDAVKEPSSEKSTSPYKIHGKIENFNPSVNSNIPYPHISDLEFYIDEDTEKSIKNRIGKIMNPVSSSLVQSQFKKDWFKYVVGYDWQDEEHAHLEDQYFRKWWGYVYSNVSDALQHEGFDECEQGMEVLKAILDTLANDQTNERRFYEDIEDRSEVLINLSINRFKQRQLKLSI